MSKADQKKIAKRYWWSISTNNNSEVCVVKLSSGVNDLSETRMDYGQKAFVKTDKRLGDQMTSSADESEKKLAHESGSIVIALPCEICEELCPSDKLIDHQLQCQKERENAKRSEVKDTSFETQEFTFNGCNTGAVHGVRYIEIQRGYSPTVEFEDDGNTYNSADDIATDFFLSGQRSDFSTPQRSEPFANGNNNSFSSTRYVEIQRSYSPMMEFQDENSPELFAHNIPEFIHTRDSTRASENRHQTNKKH